ncbi:hypothetical protein [Ruegeria jejuensis]|uniref:hypothetical protein n=1 Tax=Ruegeria jejuensis TaxID=3233338 RepID=UPI00355C0327
MSSSDISLHFAIEEYKAMREEVLDRSRLDQQLQRNGNLLIVAALGLYYSNLFDMDNPLIILASSLIALYVLLTQARFKQYGRQLGLYIKMIEERIYESGAQIELGWERQLDAIRKQEEQMHEASREQQGTPLGTLNAVVEVVRGGGYVLSSTELDRTYWKFVSAGLFLLFVLEAVLFLLGKA